MADFVFSLDLELDVGIEHFRDSHAKNTVTSQTDRIAVPKVLALCEKYSIKPTFAICGHLFLKSCNGKHNTLTPKVSYYKGNWFKNDPCSSFPKNKGWYAPDLVGQIKDAKAEIASHSFSHVPFSYTTRKVAESELKECVRLARKEKIKLKSFIFPRDEVNYQDLLQEFGFSHFVSRPPAKHFLVDYSKHEFSFNNPSKTPEGLVEVPKTLFFYRTKHSDLLKIDLLLRHAKLSDSLFHLWTHPFNLKDESYFKFLEKVFQKVNALKLESKFVKEINA